MSTIGFYFPLQQDETNALRKRLNDLAADLGYHAGRGPTAGQGNLADLLQAIDAGEVALVLLSDEQRMVLPAWLREQAATVQDHIVSAGLESLALALEKADARTPQVSDDEDVYLEEKEDTMNEERIESKAARIAQRIIENGRAATNEELQEEFEFDASEAGWSDEDIRFALKSPWFPWLKK